MKTDKNNNVVFAATYEAFGKCTILVANTNDGTRQRANTKEEDPTGFLNEGHRYRNLGTGTFLTPDPLEYVDGLNQYIYVGQNPWGRFDPLGLAFEHPAQQFGMSVAQFNMMTDALQNCAKTGDPFPTPPKTEPILEVMTEGAIKGYAAGMLGIGAVLTTGAAIEFAPAAATALGSQAARLGAKEVGANLLKNELAQVSSASAPTLATTLYNTAVELTATGVATSAETMAIASSTAFLSGYITGTKKIDDGQWTDAITGADIPALMQAAVAVYSMGNKIGQNVGDGVLKDSSAPTKPQDIDTTKSTEKPEEQ